MTTTLFSPSIGTQLTRVVEVAVHGVGHRRRHHDGRAAREPSAHARKTATAVTWSSGGDVRWVLAAVLANCRRREPRLDLGVDVPEPVPDAPRDLRVHEHDAQLDEQERVAHEVHPAGRAERVPQAPINGKQHGVEHEQRVSEMRHRLSGPDAEHHVRVPQLSLDLEKRIVPARRPGHRHRAHHGHQSDLQHRDDGRGRVLHAQRLARLGRAQVVRHGPQAHSQARAQHTQVHRVPTHGLYYIDCLKYENYVTY